MVYPIFCIYNFRHSWATIAQNNCGASTAEVGFALNHSSAHRVTEGYIKKDYSPINLLNEKVIECVFGFKKIIYTFALDINNPQSNNQIFLLSDVRVKITLILIIG